MKGIYRSGESKFNESGLRTAVAEREKLIASSRFHRKNRELIARTIRGIYSGQAKVLEVGCGHGDISKYYLAPNCKTVIATDISRRFVENNASIKTVCFMVADALNLSFEDETFDAVVAVEVIEHISDDRRFIKECMRVIKKDGVLYFTTPNRLRLTSIIRHLTGNPIVFPHTYTIDPVLGPITHEREYSYRDLTSLIGDLGNNVVKEWEIKGVWLGVPHWGIGIFNAPKVLERLSFNYHVKLVKQ